MSPMWFHRIGRVALAVLVLARASAGLAAQQAAPAASPTSKAEFEAIFRARTDSARMRFTHADAAFMSGMILHHSQALLMAGMAPSHEASASVRTLCARIINAQRDEIATMRQWLLDRGQPVPEVQAVGLKLVVRGGVPMDMSAGTWMSMPAGDSTARSSSQRAAAAQHGMDMHGHMRGMEHPAAARAADTAAAVLMPGMLTPAQMEQLERARGADFDRLFLTGMIQHHQGAIAMVRDLFTVPGAGQDGQVFKFANDVQVDQTTEIARMQRMLAAQSATQPNP